MELKVLDSSTYKEQPILNEVKVKPKMKRSKSAILTGGLVGAVPSAFVFKDAVTVDSDKAIRYMKDCMGRTVPSVDTFDNINKYAQDALQTTGLAGKGVKIKIVNAGNAKEVAEEMKQGMKHMPFAESMGKKLAKYFENGVNAAFNSANNSVYIGDAKGCYSTVFHELGHAMNHNSSKFWKFMQKARWLTPYSVPVLGLALFAASLFHTVKPAAEGQPKSLWEKTKDFVKNNIGKITFATFLPTLLEEGAASFKGIKMAKKYLTPQQITKLTKGYTKAYGSYAMVAVGLSLAVAVGGEIANEMQKKNL